LFAFAYGWSYQDIMEIPLVDLEKMTDMAAKHYKRKYMLDKAILLFFDIKDNSI
jgi:hypothetical protein